MLTVDPDLVLVASGRDVALHERWPPEDPPPRLVGEKIADLSAEQVSALLWHLQHWGAQARRPSWEGPGIFLDWLSGATLDEHEGDTMHEHQFVNMLSPSCPSEVA
jgi:hypothetical protein